METAPIPIGTTLFDGAFLREDFSFISKPIPNVDDLLAGALEYARLWSILRPTYGQKWKTAWERFYVTPREIVAKPFAIDPQREPERARQAWVTHLERAKWMTQVGYRHLLRGGAPY